MDWKKTGSSFLFFFPSDFFGNDRLDNVYYENILLCVRFGVENISVFLWHVIRMFYFRVEMSS